MTPLDTTVLDEERVAWVRSRKHRTTVNWFVGLIALGTVGVFAANSVALVILATGYPGGTWRGLETAFQSVDVLETYSGHEVRLRTSVHVLANRAHLAVLACFTWWGIRRFQARRDRVWVEIEALLVLAQSAQAERSVLDNREGAS